MATTRTKKKGAGVSVTTKEQMTYVPLRDVVIFPKVTIPLVVRREPSLTALDRAMRENDSTLVFVTQKDPETANPRTADMFSVGTLARIRELVRQEDGSVRVLVEGIRRVQIERVATADMTCIVDTDALPENEVVRDERIEALIYGVLGQFRRVVHMGANVPFDVLLVILNTSDPWTLGNFIAANLEFKIDEKIAVLGASTIGEKLQSVSDALARQVKVLQMASQIQTETGKELDKLQREMYLREQMKSIEKELEHLGAATDTDDLRERIDAANMPEAVKEKAVKEHGRLKAMPPFSPESSYIRTYLEWLVDLPWESGEACMADMKDAKRILDEDHHGLKKVKDRVLEYLAVQRLVGKIRGPILCFVGPPGTGKTSIGRSIARALKRPFHRVSLGGIRDEAEIRGHRRTYVGALPGRIIQGIANVKAKNPVFMLDEIDKIGNDFRGDPSAALLEALDPEQNSGFSDHYLEVPFDLSDTLFVATANRLDTIPPALRDRMEVIEFPGYTEEEKLHIAQNYLFPKVRKENGLDAERVSLSDDAIRLIIGRYTQEAGVRGLEREIAAVCRKIARRIAEGRRVHDRIDETTVSRLLGPARYSRTLAEESDQVGVVSGLAWTEAGGEILQIEVVRMPGKGKLILTGQLGEVMQESVKTALSFVRAQAHVFGIDPNFEKNTDIHVHVPAGAIPKDGPSAGVAMVTAIVSMLTGRPIDRTVAMTGEVTLRGRILEIGGMKEKVLAAHRAGISTVILPKRNRKDLVDVPKDVRKALRFVFLDDVLDVVKVAIGRFAKSRAKKVTEGSVYA